MKINQIITENKKVNEAPAGALTQLGRSLGSKFLNKVGAKSMAQNMAGKADLGATANKLYQQYNRYLGIRNKTIKTSTGQDLKDFLGTKNVTVNVPSGRLDPSRLDKMFLKVARDALTNKKRPAPANPAPTGAPPANPAAGNPAPTTKPGRVTLAQVKPMVSGLRPRDKQSLLKSLQKELGVSANPAPTGTPPAPPANPNPAPTGAPPAPPAPKRTRKKAAPPAP